MLSSEPLVSVMIPTKNAQRWLSALLRRLKSQTYFPHEIVIVDSGSSDETLRIARRFGCRVFEVPPSDFHHAGTRNLGVSLTKGDIVVFLSQDALPIGRDWLKHLIAPMLQDESVAAVYGRQIAYPDASPMEQFFYYYFYPRRRQVVTWDLLNNPVELYSRYVFISNVCSALRKSVWSRIPFDEKVPMAEDKKWALEVLRAGFKLVYEPRAAVFHSHNYSLVSLFKRRFDDGAALSLICGFSHNSVPNFMISAAVGYFVGGLRYVAQHRKRLLPYALLYGAAEASGLLLGKYYIYLPKLLRHLFSKHKVW